MTRDQQKRLNAMCGDLERQVRLDGHGNYINTNSVMEPGEIRIGKDSWRWMFVGTFKGWKTLPALEGNGFIMLGASSRDLSVGECMDVMLMMQAFGDARGVHWSDPAEAAAVAAYEAQP